MARARSPFVRGCEAVGIFTLLSLLYRLLNGIRNEIQHAALVCLACQRRLVLVRRHGRTVIYGRNLFPNDNL
jgi:hypothetical protein